MVVIAAAIAASDFVPVREANDCAISMRPEDAPGGAAMRAECTWPDVDSKTMIAMLGHYEEYPTFVFPVSEARVVRQEADRTLVYQRQSMFGIADREVLLWMSETPTEAGGARFSWTTADEEPLVLGKGAIRTPKNVGYWQVEPAPGGGSAVVHEVALDAGGSIPHWLVALVRNSSFSKIMGDVRARVLALP